MQRLHPFSLRLNVKRVWAVLSVGALLLTISQGLFTPGTARASTTVSPVLLGNPLKGRYPDGIAGNPMEYARNPWDMQVLNGRIYIGSGNSANNNPALNAGSQLFGPE